MKAVDHLKDLFVGGGKSTWIFNEQWSVFRFMY